LEGAYLEGAYLRKADLRRTDLRRADLVGADLAGANLEGADLVGANLVGANLQGANLPIFCKWSCPLVDGLIKIGCRTKSVEDWEEFFAGSKVYDTPRDSSDFVEIEAMFKAHKAYLGHINQNSK